MVLGSGSGRLGASAGGRVEAMQAHGEAVFVGSSTGASVRYLTLINGQAIAADSIGDILTARQLAGAPVEVDHGSISHLLHDGFVPQPFTVYRDVFAISIGFSAKASHGKFTFERDFPFRQGRSTENQTGGSDALLDRLASATSEACSARQNAVLLLSAGLDSTSIAVAAKHAGHNDLLCVTYGEPEQQSEVELARAVCRQLGLRHEAHIVSVEAPKLRHSLIAYAANAPEPCADPATIASISAVGSYCDRDTVVLDGSGSDYYFWSPPRRLDALKIRLSPGRFQAVRSLRRLLPFYTRHERLLASPIEPYLLHGSWLRHCDSRRFYTESADTHLFWLGELRAHGEIPSEEARFQARAMYVGPGAHMMKIRNAATWTGGIALFPWASQEVAEFCFNLPQRHRFDRKSGKSKVVVRQMLREAIAYDDDLIGKRPFLFGKRSFLEAHMDFCRDQILNCTLWSREIENTVSRLIKKLRQGQHTENALLALLMVSLWHRYWFVDRFGRRAEPQPLQQVV